MSPEDPSHLRSLLEALPNASVRRLRRSPCRTALRRLPPVPEVSPKPFLRKPSSKLPRNPPRVPSAERNISPPGFFPSCHASPNAPHREDFPSDVARVAICLRVPSENLPPGALRATTCPETHPEKIPNALRPECRVNVPGCLRLRRVFRVADLPAAHEPPRKTPSRALGECAACQPSRERVFC